MTRGLTPDEEAKLRIETPKALERAGAANHERSVFIRMLGEEVVGSANPLFASMQPKVKPHSSEAWSRAFAFVLNFLNRNVPHAFAIAAVELRERGVNPTAKAPVDIFALLRVRRLPFNIRVKQQLSNSAASTQIPRFFAKTEPKSDGDDSFEIMFTENPASSPEKPRKATVDDVEVEGFGSDEFDLGLDGDE